MCLVILWCLDASAFFCPSVSWFFFPYMDFNFGIRSWGLILHLVLRHLLLINSLTKLSSSNRSFLFLLFRMTQTGKCSNVLDCSIVFQLPKSIVISPLPPLGSSIVPKFVNDAFPFSFWTASLDTGAAPYDLIWRDRKLLSGKVRAGENKIFTGSRFNV